MGFTAPYYLHACMRSIKEPGLYDYVIFNDDLDEAFSQLATVARRALAGQVGSRLWLTCHLLTRPTHHCRFIPYAA